MRLIYLAWLSLLIFLVGFVSIVFAGLDKEQKRQCETWNKQILEYRGMVRTTMLKEICNWK